MVCVDSTLPFSILGHMCDCSLQLVYKLDSELMTNCRMEGISFFSYSVSTTPCPFVHINGVFRFVFRGQRGRARDHSGHLNNRVYVQITTIQLLWTNIFIAPTPYGHTYLRIRNSWSSLLLGRLKRIIKLYGNIMILVKIMIPFHFKLMGTV